MNIRYLVTHNDVIIDNLKTTEIKHLHNILKLYRVRIYYIYYTKRGFEIENRYIK